MPKPQIKKLRVGWFSFTCCEDSTIVFTELLNENWEAWKKLIDFRHARILQTKNVLDEMDVAFVEGAISSPEQAEKLKKIRSLSTMLVAIGACAVIGLPSSQRNDFDEKTKEEIEFILTRFNHLDRVQPLKELVKVDVEIPGCPMDEKKFLATVDLALKKFKII
ncbi:MAG: hypothetical protein ABII13_03290 [Patescibacteria group bacterium]|nr:hypothetical protein [Patescibacteria group bacterium]MBU2509198.1 hypothetical protein [Patescibacteria group bacterium]